MRLPLSLVAALLLVDLANEWLTFFPAGSIESIRADLGLTYAEVGFLLVALPAGALGGNAIAIAADFVSRRLLASVGALVYGVCLIAFGLTDSFVVLLVASVVWGVAADAFVHACQVAVVDLCQDDLAAALGRVNALGAIGDLLGPITLAGAAAVGIGWRAVFMAGGVAIAAYAGWLATQRFPAPRPPDEAASPLNAIVTLARDRRLILFALISTLFSILDEPFLGFTIAFLEDERDHSAAAATGLITIGVAAGVVGYVTAPLVARRIGLRRLLIVSTVGLALAVPAIIVAPSAGPQAAALAAFGFASATFYTSLETSYLSLHPGLAGTSGAVVSAVDLLGIGFPALVGAASDAAGLTTGLALYALVPLGILVLVALIQETMRKDSSRCT